MTYPDNASSKTPKSLAGDMVSATRSIHTKINKLITSRLRLAVPPQAPDAGLYVSGLLHILPIYMTIEKLWLDIIETLPVENVLDHSIPNAEGGKDEKLEVSERVQVILKELYLPQLFRSDSLKADIKSVTGWSDDVLNRQINAIKGTGQLSAFISHIKQIIHAKPHTLVAYSYNLFMALFAGGRFIRAVLENVGDEFWEAVPAPIKPTMQPCESRSDAISPLELVNDSSLQQMAETSLHPDDKSSLPLQFWRFDSDNDGDDLKQEYKKRLLQRENELTAEEREDIAQESVIILESIGFIVGQLDTVCSNEQDEKPISQMPTRPSLASLFGNNQFGARLRDSLLIARERGMGNPFRSQSLDAAEAEKRERDSANESGNHVDTAESAEVCAGIPKSMRFAKSLPIPPRRHGRIAAAKDSGSNNKLRVKSQRHDVNGTMVRPALVGVFGLFFLYVLYSRVSGIVS
jgi:heme oxygenase